MPSTDYLIKETCVGYIAYRIVDDTYQYIGRFEDYPSRSQLSKGEIHNENNIG